MGDIMTPDDFDIVIDDDLTVNIFNRVLPAPGNVPFIVQPQHPDGHAWVDRDEAHTWANAFVADYCTPLPAPE